MSLLPLNQRARTIHSYRLRSQRACRTSPLLSPRKHGLYPRFKSGHRVRINNRISTTIKIPKPRQMNKNLGWNTARKESQYQQRRKHGKIGDNHESHGKRQFFCETNLFLFLFSFILNAILSHSAHHFGGRCGRSRKFRIKLIFAVHWQKFATIFVSPPNQIVQDHHSGRRGMKNSYRSHDNMTFSQI